ncbi:ABC transporter ATP-binding protein [Amycolatopsis jejuensis]|uniref:ABC transporter ATP-binding protein n=1 Tax=Amycolatopsis jejuensis TaxID=330084 RepID=UPI0007C456EE|nr:ABC transporter ATP-binding protein [Amycolatopsis jejuensis]
MGIEANDPAPRTSHAGTRPRRRERGLPERLRVLAGDRDPARAVRAAGSRVLRSAARQSWPAMLLLGAITVLHIGTGLLTPQAVAAAVDAASRGAGLPDALIWLAVLLVVSMAATAADDVVSAYFGSSLTARLRHRLVDRLLALGVAGPLRLPAGDALTRLTENAAGPAAFLPMLLSASSTVLTALGAVAGLALIDPWLALPVVVGGPLAAVLVRRFTATAGDAMQRYQRAQGELATRLLDALRGVRTIRAAGTAGRDIARVLTPVRQLHCSGVQLWAAQGRVSWQMSLLTPLLQIAVLAVGGFALTEGEVSAGQLVAAASYVAMALGAVGLLDTVVALMSCQVGAGRVGEVVQTPPAITPPARPLPLPDGHGRVEFRAVTVREDGDLLLDRIDLTVPAGCALAVVGRSGSGKSALTGLLGRLRDPAAGQVALDGVDVRAVELTELRRAVGYAFERPALLGATVADLIGYGATGDDRDRVERAARIAQADGFIRKLPRGYDTPLADAPFSGGELQRLGLARALCVDARVLVLDDATSSLDTATEVRVTAALRSARAGRTTVTVARRIATAADADLVAWLDKGRLRAVATHDFLWRDPDYRAIFTTGEEFPAHDRNRAVS